LIQSDAHLKNGPNPEQKLLEANKKIRYITYQCNNTITAESEKIINIPTPNIEAAQSKGQSVIIDIIEDCKIVCKIDVSGRKAPLKMYVKELKLDLFKMTSVEVLKVFVSDENKNPDEKTSQQIFVNPGGKFIIKKQIIPEELGPDGKPKKAKKFSKKDKNTEDCFECKSIYIGFYSSNGCSL
jgi:hypothetical protein